MISSSEAKANSVTYTQKGMNWFDRHRVKRLIKKIDKLINKASDVNLTHCKFTRYVDDYISLLSSETVGYYMMNIATMYETKGLNVDLKHKEQKHSDGSSMTLYELSLDWSDTEFEELISKYK